MAFDSVEMKALLKNSADVRYYRGNIKFLSVFLSLWAVFFILICAFSGLWKLMLIVVPMVLIIGTAVIYYVLRISSIYKALNRYSVFEVKLDSPHSGFRRMMAFTVNITDEQGRTFQADTRAVFHIGGSFSPLFDEYINKRALAAYDEENGYAVVLKILR